MAAMVNGEGIQLADYERELTNLQSAQSELNITASPEEQKQKVLDDLIDQTLLAQAAYKNGYKSEDADIQAKVDQMVNQLGGQYALATWQSQYGYTPDSFLRSMKLTLASALQRDQIADQVPLMEEQVHARQILVLNADTANQIYQLLQNGSDFSDLVARYHPVTRGELGWFPRGYLTQPDIEAAAFSLKPGEYSQVIQTSFGYHIVQVLEHADSRQLSPDALKIRKHEALKDWLEKQRAQSEITILIQ
jgi:peptidyl-prolyl cis-trans isomerase C